MMGKNTITMSRVFTRHCYDSLVKVNYHTNGEYTSMLGHMSPKAGQNKKWKFKASFKTQGYGQSSKQITGTVLQWGYHTVFR